MAANLESASYDDILVLCAQTPGLCNDPKVVALLDDKSRLEFLEARDSGSALVEKYRARYMDRMLQRLFIRKQPIRIDTGSSITDVNPLSQDRYEFIMRSDSDFGIDKSDPGYKGMINGMYLTEHIRSGKYTKRELREARINSDDGYKYMDALGEVVNLLSAETALFGF